MTGDAKEDVEWATTAAPGAVYFRDSRISKYFDPPSIHGSLDWPTYFPF